MNELEERMFRLAEALRSLEPENASRLRLALKFSREELILQQMKESQKLLKEAQLAKAETASGSPDDPPEFGRWLEASGYDVSYFTGVDSDRLGTEILKHKTFMSVGHDEYWSAQQRANIQAARDAS